MNPKEAIQKLEHSEVFRNWQNQNQGYYLVHVFYMTGHPVQVGYYSEKADNIVTFDVDEKVNANPASDVFKESSTVSALDMEKVMLTLDEARVKMKDLIENEYPTTKHQKEMIILQDMNGDMVYNATYFTVDFKTLNIKINATDGKVISHSLDNLISF